MCAVLSTYIPTTIFAPALQGLASYHLYGGGPSTSNAQCAFLQKRVSSLLLSSLSLDICHIASYIHTFMALDRGQDASPPARLDQSPFFQQWERTGRRATQSDSINESRLSSESSHPSPKSTVATPRLRKLRQTLAERSISAPAGTIPELAVPTIANLKAQRQSRTAELSDESSTSKQGQHSLSGDSSQRRRGSKTRAGADSKKSSVSSATRRLRSRIRVSLPDFRISEYRIKNSAKELFPPRKERPGYEWTKASPKDDWVERLISIGGIMQRRGKSADPPPVPIVPLRPPASRNISQGGTERAVKMETSFGKLRAESPLKKQQLPHTGPRPSIVARTKSIIVKRVRFALKRGNSADHSLSQRQSPSTPLRSSLLLARNRTAEGLQRVASILHFMVADGPSRATNDRSHHSHEPALPNELKHSHRKGTFHLPAVIRNRTRKSPSESYTSSLRKMRRGATPANTPDPQETYRVKRSPSAETEEFFKIDISIRGGTSYLPSEARRVHTPPLPGDGPGQKRMGFFFDYTAPSVPTSPVVGDQSTESVHLRPSPNVRPRRGKTIGGTDWYEAKLAEVDAVGDEFSELEMASRLATTENETANLNVPEHLPGSPLCPRHWKHRSGGKGNCWMHGRNANAGVRS